MAGFVRQNVLSGKDKAAMLFCELGSSVTGDMLKYFSTAELKKLRKHIEKLGTWYDVYAENSVLEETARYGMMKRFLPADTIIRAEDNARAAVAQEHNPLKNINPDPEALANVLAMWLKEE